MWQPWPPVFPNESGYRPGQGKILLREAARPLLPAGASDRAKHPFMGPPLQRTEALQARLLDGPQLPLSIAVDLQAEWRTQGGAVGPRSCGLGSSLADHPLLPSAGKGTPAMTGVQSSFIPPSAAVSGQRFSAQTAVS